MNKDNKQLKRELALLKLMFVEQRRGSLSSKKSLTEYYPFSATMSLFVSSIVIHHLLIMMGVTWFNTMSLNTRLCETTIAIHVLSECHGGQQD